MPSSIELFMIPTKMFCNNLQKGLAKNKADINMREVYVITPIFI
jgi:hypothetical protein